MAEDDPTEGAKTRAEQHAAAHTPVISAGSKKPQGDPETSSTTPAMGLGAVIATGLAVNAIWDGIKEMASQAAKALTPTPVPPPDPKAKLIANLAAELRTLSTRHTFAAMSIELRQGAPIEDAGLVKIAERFVGGKVVTARCVPLSALSNEIMRKANFSFHFSPELHAEGTDVRLLLLSVLGPDQQAEVLLFLFAVGLDRSNETEPFFWLFRLREAKESFGRSETTISSRDVITNILDPLREGRCWRAFPKVMSASQFLGRPVSWRMW